MEGTSCEIANYVLLRPGAESMGDERLGYVRNSRKAVGNRVWFGLDYCLSKSLHLCESVGHEPATY